MKQNEMWNFSSPGVTKCKMELEILWFSLQNVNLKTRDYLVVTPDFDTTTRESLVKNSLVL